MRRLRISMAGLVAGAFLVWAIPAASLQEPVAGGVEAQIPAESESDPVYGVAAVAASVANIPTRIVACSVGGIAGFIVGAVLRLPIWAATLGDRVGSSEALDRIGSTIVERACEGPWIFPPEPLREPVGTAGPTGTGAAGGERVAPAGAP